MVHEIVLIPNRRFHSKPFAVADKLKILEIRKTIPNPNFG